MRNVNLVSLSFLPIFGRSEPGAPSSPISLIGTPTPPPPSSSILTCSRTRVVAHDRRLFLYSLLEREICRRSSSCCSCCVSPRLLRPLCSRRLVRRPCRLHGQLLAPALSPRAHTCQAASARLALVFHQSTRSRARAPLATRPAAPVGSARPTLPDVRALGVPLLARSTRRAASARPALNFDVSW